MAETTTAKSTRAKKTAAPRKPAASAKPSAAKASAADAPKAKFAKALDQARAGVQAFGKEAQDRAGAYRQQVAGAGSEWLEEAREVSGMAKERAVELAQDGKTRASEAIGSLGQIVADSASVVDEKIGAKYGDYARTAAKSMQDAAAKLEAKDIGELGEDAKEFVRKSPGLAIGIAAVAGFMLARAFRKPDEE